MPPSLIARYCRFITRRAWLVLAAAAAVFAGSLSLAARLELRTAFSELLPSDDPGVVALEKTQKRLGDMTLLLVGIHSPDREANLRYAEMFTRKLRDLPDNVIDLATYHVRDLRAFFERNKWLYLSEEDLTEIRDRLRREIAQKKNPMLVDLGLDDEPIDALKARVTGRDPLQGKFPGGVFSSQDGKYVWIAALPPGGLFGERAGESLFQAALALEKQNDPSAFHPQMRVWVGGPVATLIANRAAVERDIVWVTATCITIVGLSILLFFRRFRPLPQIGAPAVLGTVMAFAVAQLAFGYVNSSTAFLGSIIVGNGINYAIILIARYHEQRASGQDPLLALESAIAGVVRGTAVAAVCASAAYASLMLTSFRGFYQFGVMGGVGVLLCWLATFTMVPAMLHLSEGRKSKTTGTWHAPLSLASLGRVLNRRARTFVVVSVLLTVGSSFGMLHFTAEPFEYDFNKLKAILDVSDEQHRFDRSQNQLFGRWPSPTIILADEVEEVDDVRAAIERQDTGPRGAVIGQVVTVFDVLPGSSEEQRRKLELIADIARLKNDTALDLATPEEKKTLTSINPPPDLEVLRPQDLPPLARRPFTEADGTVGRVLLVYPIEEGFSVWSGRDLLYLAKVLQRLELPEQDKVIETSGSAVVFAAMIRSILQDGPIATVASLLSVVLLILIVMRPVRYAVLAILTMVMGVLWMVGAAGYAEVKITFLNFIALPITFGIGAEYAINVVSRHRESRDMAEAVASTGSAVALCSWTTIVGYGSLLAARNRALQGFGAMAILGEIACLATAIIALPSLVIWLRRRRAPARPPQATASA